MVVVAVTICIHVSTGVNRYAFIRLVLAQTPANSLTCSSIHRSPALGFRVPPLDGCVEWRLVSFCSALLCAFPCCLVLVVWSGPLIDWQQSADFLRHLPNAVFVSIDEEMTGISKPQNGGRPPKDDEPATRYETHLKEVPEHYSVMQVGICLFTAEDELRQYNFHLFPSSPQTDVTMNASSMHFLKKHGMDFNQWIRQGVPYCDHAMAKKKILQRFSKLQDPSQGSNGAATPQSGQRDRVVLTRQEDLQFRARAMASLREWIDNPIGSVLPPPAPDANDANAAQVRQQIQQQQQERLSLLLPPCSSFLRRAMYEAIQEEYPSLILEKEGYDQIRVWRLTEEERRERERQQKQAHWEGLLMELGFWRIFVALSRANQGLLGGHGLVDADFGYEQLVGLFGSKEQNGTSDEKANGGTSHDGSDDDLSHRLEAWIDQVIPSSNTTTNSSSMGVETMVTNERQGPVPIVVHNGLMDLMFLLTHCHAPKLPDSYSDMKRVLHQTFPCVYDTKVMASESPVRSDQTALSQLFQRMVTENEEDGVGDDDDDDFVVTNDDSPAGDTARAHEAAYDAYMTGAIFVRLCQRIRIDVRQQHQQEQERQQQEAQDTEKGTENTDGAPEPSELSIMYPWQPDAQDKDLRKFFCRNKVSVF